ncbi:MAG: NADPH-dependent F420 reductase [Mycobacteriales bacterium]
MTPHVVPIVSREERMAHMPSGERDASLVSVGIVGGTGPQGRGLATRFAAAGNRVLIGSRDPERAQKAAAELSEATGAEVVGADNTAVAQAADVVVIAVPWAGHAATVASLVSELHGKIVVDCVNPLGFDDRGAYPVHVAEGSAAEQAAALLPDSMVVGAFHHLSAVLLADTSVERLEGDVLVVGDDRASTNLVCELAGRMAGLRGIYAGALRNCHQVEALTANLIAVNRRYRAHAGIRLTDV